MRAIPPIKYAAAFKEQQHPRDQGGQFTSGGGGGGAQEEKKSSSGGGDRDKVLDALEGFGFDRRDFDDPKEYTLESMQELLDYETEQAEEEREAGAVEKDREEEEQQQWTKTESQVSGVSDKAWSVAEKAGWIAPTGIYRSKSSQSRYIDLERSAGDKTEYLTIRISDHAAPMGAGFNPESQEYNDPPDVDIVLNDDGTADLSNLQERVGGQKKKSAATSTPEFKNWFGDSKVVDKQGEPLVVYHGTTADTITQPDESAGREAGIYLTNDPEYASGYATSFSEFNDPPQPPPEGAKVMPAYVSMTNPLFVLTKPHDPDSRVGFSVSLMKQLQDEGYDGLIVGMTPYEYEQGHRNIKDHAEEIVPFDVRQIKSSTGNQGSFDPEDPRINYAKFDESKHPRDESGRFGSGGGGGEEPVDLGTHGTPLGEAFDPSGGGGVEDLRPGQTSDFDDWGFEGHGNFLKPKNPDLVWIDEHGRNLMEPRYTRERIAAMAKEGWIGEGEAKKRQRFAVGDFRSWRPQGWTPQKEAASKEKRGKTYHDMLMKATGNARIKEGRLLTPEERDGIQAAAKAKDAEGGPEGYSRQERYAKWKEDEHPRDESGRFGEGGGGADKPKMQTAKEKAREKELFDQLVNTIAQIDAETPRKQRKEEKETAVIGGREPGVPKEIAETKLTGGHRRPVYLSGSVGEAQKALAEKHEDTFGFLVTPDTKSNLRKVHDYPFFGVDNGGFGGKFNEKKFRSLLDAIQEQGVGSSVLFVAAPDVFDPDKMKGDPLATIEKSRPWFKEIRERGLPAALVAQDGIEQYMDQIPWDDFDVVFMGGGDDWKEGYFDGPVTDQGLLGFAEEVRAEWDEFIDEAHKRGKRIHVGRVNSAERLAFSYAIGADSVDGNFITFAPDINSKKVEKWLDDMYDREGEALYSLAEKIGGKPLAEMNQQEYQDAIKEAQGILYYRRAERYAKWKEDEHPRDESGQFGSGGGGGKPADKPKEEKKSAPTFATGRPVSFSYIRNTESSPDVGDTFGQHVEPHGRYLSVKSPVVGDVSNMPGWEDGTVEFNSPLVVDFGGGYRDESNWKHVLSQKYGGKTGADLSQAVRDDGYDAIVTTDEHGPSEIVDLARFSPKEEKKSQGINGLESTLLDKHQEHLDALVLSEGKDYVKLHTIRMKEGSRGRGTGSTIIRELQEYAEQQGKPIVLEARAEPRKKKALDDFYRSHGFRRPGRSRDYSLPANHTHIWLPKFGLTLNYAKWEETDHPRDEGGRFGEGGGGAATAEGKPKMQTAQEKKSTVTSTPEFKNWFGESKVVRDDGTPLVVHHGTIAEMGGEFAFDAEKIGSANDPGFFGQGFYFVGYPTMKPGTARGEAGYYGKNVGDFYLSLQNPLDLTSPQGVYSTQDRFLNWYPKLQEVGLGSESLDRQLSFYTGIKSHVANNAKTAKDSDRGFKAWVEHPDTHGVTLTGSHHGVHETPEEALEHLSVLLAENVTRARDDYDLSRFTTLSDYIRTEGLESRLTEGAQANGHDGVISGDEYIVFDPASIKSATDNTGSFDPEDPRINYSMLTEQGHKASHYAEKIAQYAAKREQKEWYKLAFKEGEHKRDESGQFTSGGGGRAPSELLEAREEAGLPTEPGVLHPTLHPPEQFLSNSVKRAKEKWPHSKPVRFDQLGPIMFYPVTEWPASDTPGSTPGPGRLLGYGTAPPWLLTPPITTNEMEKHGGKRAAIEMRKKMGRPPSLDEDGVPSWPGPMHPSAAGKARDEGGKTFSYSRLSQMFEAEYYARQMTLWEEEDHPRDADGKFGSGTGGKKPKEEKKSAPESKEVTFTVRGHGNWTWDGATPSQVGIGGRVDRLVTNTATGQEAWLLSYTDGYRLVDAKEDGKPDFWNAITKGTKDPLKAAQEKRSAVKDRAREFTQEQGAAARDKVTAMMDDALAELEGTAVSYLELSKNDTATGATSDEFIRLSRDAAETGSRLKIIFPKILDAWGNKAVSLIGEVNTVKFHANQEELAEASGSDDPGVAGFYRYTPGVPNSNELHLTASGLTEESQESIVAHEMAHALEGVTHVFSDTRKWKNAWKKEIGSQEKINWVEWPNDKGTMTAYVGTKASDLKVGDRMGYQFTYAHGVEFKEVKSIKETRVMGFKQLHITYHDLPPIKPPYQYQKVEDDFHVPGHVVRLDTSDVAPDAPLTRYAQTLSSEGFAEFGRQIVEDKAHAKEFFPKCYKLWQEWGLVDD